MGNLKADVKEIVDRNLQFFIMQTQINPFKTTDYIPYMKRTVISVDRQYGLEGLKQLIGYDRMYFTIIEKEFGKKVSDQLIYIQDMMWKL